MQLRNGRFGQFYFCRKSTVKKLHGIVNKAEYDAAATSLENVFKGDSQDLNTREHLRKIEKAAGETIVDFFTDYAT
jgi:uncharacterized protein YbcI